MKSIVNDIARFCSVNKLDHVLLNDEDSVSLVTTLASSFTFDLGRRWLWEDIQAAAERSIYPDNQAYCDIFVRLLNNFQTDIFLAVTDDEFFPWPVISCSKQNILQILQESQHFEFFLFDKTMRTVLFDTHHDELILARI